MGPRLLCSQGFRLHFVGIAMNIHKHSDWSTQLFARIVNKQRQHYRQSIRDAALVFRLWQVRAAIAGGLAEIALHECFFHLKPMVSL